MLEMFAVLNTMWFVSPQSYEATQTLVHSFTTSYHMFDAS